jgi:translation elongation factor EF-Tu-like GTPase
MQLRFHIMHVHFTRTTGQGNIARSKTALTKLCKSHDDVLVEIRKQQEANVAASDELRKQKEANVAAAVEIATNESRLKGLDCHSHVDYVHNEWFA